MLLLDHLVYFFDLFLHEEKCLFVIIYLSVTVFTINVFFVLFFFFFFYIIGSSVFHNSDGYTVSLLKQHLL